MFRSLIVYATQVLHDFYHVSVGVHILLAAEQSSLEGRSRECAKTPILAVYIHTYIVQLTTSRIGNLTRLIRTLAICVTIHTYIPSGTIIGSRV